MFFSFVNLAHASVFINEVQISPIEERFIELYNNGSSSIDLTDWYIQRKTANGTFGSMVTKTNFEGKSIEANGYFLIAKSGSMGADIVMDTFTLTESNTIQIKDGEGNVINKVGWGETNDCQNPCPLNPINDQSISRTLNGDFVISNPTPRETNEGILNDDIPVSSSNNSSNSSSSNNNKEEIINIKTKEISKIITKIIAPKIVTAGVPFEIDHNTTGINKEKIILGKFIWNFGDGMSRSGATSDVFNYIYDYPGEYVITLSYSDSTFDTKPDAVDRLTVKVISSGVVISSVGTYTDPFVELENKSNYEMSISGWILRGGVHAFMIPEGTVILSNKKLKFSPKITGFDFNDLSSINIIDKTGQIFATYPNIINPIVKYSAKKNPIENIVKSEIIESNQIDSIENSPEIINLNDLGASAGGVENGLENKTLMYLGLAGIIIIGIISVILIRRKDDYPDYVEKGLKASDMTIIE